MKSPFELGATNSKLIITEKVLRRFKEVGVMNDILGVGGEYQPRLYPAITMPSIPDRMKKLMSHLDSFSLGAISLYLTIFAS